MVKRLLLSSVLVLAFAQVANAQSALGVGISNTIFNATATVTTGTSYAVPSARAYILTWAVDYASAPGSITLCIQGSNNNVAWFDLTCTSSTTDTGGNIGPTSIKFVRVNISAVAAGTSTMVTIVPQGFNNPAVFSGGTLVTPLIVPEGSATAPGLQIGTSANIAGLFRISNTTFIQSATTVAGFNNSTGLTLHGSVPFGFTTGDPSATAVDTRFRRTAASTVTFDNGAGGNASFVVQGDIGNNLTNTMMLGTAAAAKLSWWVGSSIFAATTAGVFRFSNDASETRRLVIQAADIPTCTTNCGTSPTVVGVGSSFTVTMGTTPASGFLITFPTAWAAAPQCTGAMALAGMVVGKLPLTLVTTTTTLTIVTNGTAPATGDKYHFQCSLGQ